MFHEALCFCYQNLFTSKCRALPCFPVLLQAAGSIVSQVLLSSTVRQRSWASSPASQAHHCTVPQSLSYLALSYSLQLLWEFPRFPACHLYPPPIASIMWGLSFYFFLIVFTLKIAMLQFFQEPLFPAVLSFWAVSFCVSALQNFPSPFVSRFSWTLYSAHKGCGVSQIIAVHALLLLMFVQLSSNCRIAQFPLLGILCSRIDLDHSGVKRLSSWTSHDDN